MKLSDARLLPTTPAIYLISLIADPTKYYVGRALDPRKRIGQSHRRATPGDGASPKLYNAIRKYGADAFEVDIIASYPELLKCSKDDALKFLAKMERAFLEPFAYAGHRCTDCSSPLPYFNVSCRTSGGACGPLREDTKEKIRAKAFARGPQGPRPPVWCQAIGNAIEAYWASPAGRARAERQRTNIEGWRQKLNAGIREDAASGRTSERNRRSGLQPKERARRADNCSRLHKEQPEMMHRRTRYRFKSPDTRGRRILNIQHMRKKLSS